MVSMYVFPTSHCDCQADLDKWLRWTLGSITTFLACGRFYIRWRFFKRLHWDDLFFGLAYICFIVCFVIYIYDLTLDLTPQFLEMQVAYSMLLWSNLWMVKASFLAFCWTIFHPSPKFRKAWWVLVVYTFLSYWPIVLAQLWQAGDPSQYANPDAFQTFQATAGNRSASIVTGMAATLHASSEILILALPLAFINKLHMSRARKVSAAAVFAVTIIDIILGIVRNVAEICYYQGYGVDNSFTLFTVLESCEPGIAVIVCAMPAYKVLLPSLFQRRGNEQMEERPQPRQDQQTEQIYMAANAGEARIPRKQESA